jgi:virginiamycin B lyase
VTRAFPIAVLLLTAASASAAAQDVLPEGDGMDIVRTKCRTCHMATRVTQVAGRTPEGWQTLVTSMINRGATVTEDEVPIVVEYLAKNWPVDKKVDIRTFTPLAAMASHVRAEFTEWSTPSAAAEPQASLIGSDGSLWYTGTNANVIGRVDPKTGAVKDYPLKTAESKPDGLAEDRDGAIWYAGRGKALLGKLDPRSGNITEYPLGDPAARDPHALAVDQKGNLWFTVDEGNMVGRFAPATGEVKLKRVPTANSRPYGIAVTSKGTAIYAAFGTNKLGSVDPTTLVVREWKLPDAAARPRRVAVDANDMIWYTDNARGFIGRLNPATGEVKEWAAPGGADSKPSAIAVIDNDVWFSETGSTPTTLVRFETATERFQTWNIPSGGGAVETISPSKDGTALSIAERAAGAIALVTLRKN